MKPDELLDLAEQMPSNFGVESYRDSICALRRKGYSWRGIADFFVEKGITTDHTRVYRTMMDGDPLYDFNDGPLCIGRALFESQKGLPLREYSVGMFISLKAKLGITLLEHPERITSGWCQSQFQLSTRPNRVWLKQLHHELVAEFRSDWPGHLVSGMGFELKFDGDVMAFDCLVANLEQLFKIVSEGITRTNQHFQKDKAKWLASLTMSEARKKKILELYSRGAGESEDAVLDGHVEDYAERSVALNERFNKLEI